LRRLIVSADDFGLSTEVNDAVEDGHRNGVLRAASLMMAAPATDDAIRRAHAMPTLRVGLHVVLVNGRPILPAQRVPDLVDDDGAFFQDLGRAGVRFFFSRRARTQLEAEIRAQFAAFAATGLVLDHVNAQNHMHVHPTVLSLIVRIGREYDVRAVRVPREPWLRSWRGTRASALARASNAVFLAPWLALMKARIRAAGIVCNDFVFGMNDTGHVDAACVRSLIPHLPRGISELYFHPATRGWEAVPHGMERYDFAGEHRALVDPAVIEAIETSGVRMTTYTELAS